MPDLNDESEGLSSKLDKVVDSKTQANGKLLYKVRWVSFSWVPEEYLSSHSNLVKSFILRKQQGTSTCDDQSLQCISGGQELHVKLQKLQEKLDAEHENSSASKRRTVDIDSYDIQQRISKNDKAISDLTLQVKELQNKREIDCQNRNEVVQILSKLLLSQENNVMQTRQHEEAIRVIREAMQYTNDYAADTMMERDPKCFTETVTNQPAFYEETEHNDKSPVNGLNGDAFPSNAEVECNVENDATEEVEIEADSKGNNTKQRETSIKINTPIRKTRKRSLIKKDYPRRASSRKIKGVASVMEEKDDSVQIPHPSSKDSLLYLPGSVVNVRTALTFKVKNLKTEEDFTRHAEALTPRFGQLVAYRCKLDQGVGSLLQCFVKKSPSELEGQNSFINISKYSKKYHSKLHWSVTRSMQISLRSLGYLSNDSTNIETEPVPSITSKSLKTRRDIFEAVLYSQGPIVTKQSCRDALKKCRPPALSEDFAYHIELLSPDFGQQVKYDVVARKNLICFIKKHPDEVTREDIDIERYSKRYFTTIHCSVTTKTQMSLVEHGYISAELLTNSQQLITANMDASANDLEENESYVDENDDEHTELPAVPNENLIKCILNAQGPILNYRCMKGSFKHQMKGVSPEEFSNHCRLLAPDYGKCVSYRIGKKGGGRIRKCFVKKPPSEMSGNDLDLERYSRRYYAPIHSSFTPAMIMALKRLGHISEEAFSGTGVFSPLVQKGTAYQEDDTVEESSDSEEDDANEEDEILQAVAATYNI